LVVRIEWLGAIADHFAVVCTVCGMLVMLGMLMQFCEIGDNIFVKFIEYISKIIVFKPGARRPKAGTRLVS